MAESEIDYMSRKPCRECPFSRAFEGKYNSENVILFLAGVMSDDGQICHLTDDADCEGARRFMEGRDALVFDSLVELAEARGRDSMAAEFCRQIERLNAAEANVVPEREAERTTAS